MGPKTDTLLQTLEALTAILRKANQGHWANMLEECQRHIRQGDFYGVEKFLSLFGGMGSLNDLMIRVAGERSMLSGKDASTANEQLHWLLSQAYSLAADLKREAVIG